MPSAGQLNERVRFSRRTAVSDAYGNEQASWADQFDRAAQFIMRPGSEAVFSARLEGRQPLTVIVRRDSQTETITPDWRVTDLRTSKVYAIRAAEDMDRTRAWISMVCEGGVAA